MQFSEHWLRTFVNPPLTSGELAHLLTMAGLEVEAQQPVAPAFIGVVVAQILSCDRHPNADKLKLCRVDAGQGEALQIVCGAPNAAVGIKVPCALVGAELPGLSIKAAKVRGVESFGMLCSARELGLSQDHAGLLTLAADAPVGADIRDHLRLDDKLFTLKLTPNRSDCLSLLGIAREVAALTGAPLSVPEIGAAATCIDARRDIVLDAPEACPRYCGRIIGGVDPAAPTPSWLVRRLERSGVRSISAVVDVTNYVMLELGQPLHAFDNAKLTGAIHVRFPRPGEKLLLLNEQTVDPSADTLLICDEARVLALAGIMGGEDSGIGATTTDLFLESAFFAPEAVAGKARSYGFSSDASYRFERGVDFAATRRAIERATQLIVDICGGRAGPITEAAARLPERPPVRLRPARAQRLLGVGFDAGQIERLLGGLGFEFRREGEDFVVTPPSYRFDIGIEEDLIEELARLHGYDNIPATTPASPTGMPHAEEQRRSVSVLRMRLVGRDYQEVVNFSFVDREWEQDFCASRDMVVLSNPIASQMSVMRSSLIGGLVANLATNLRRRTDRVRVFEVGRCFLREPSQQAAADAVAGFHQPLRLGALCAGPAVTEQWGVPTREVDFFDIKADVEAILAPRVARYERVAHPAFHPGRSAAIVLDGSRIGVIGEIHPQWVQKYELGTAPVAFELDLRPLERQPLPSYRELSRFPAVVRDIALLVRQDVSAQALLDCLRRAAPALVQDVQLFDLYAGKGVVSGEKSLAFRVVMQDTERTLADAEVETALTTMIEVAGEELSARLRV